MELNEKQRQALTAGLILAAAALLLTGYFYFFNFKPARETAQKEWTRTEATIATLKKDIQMMEDFASNRAEMERLMAQVEQARRRLPSDPEAVQFLQVLRDSLRKTGVGFTRVAQGRLVNRSLYSEIPYSIKGSARYHELGQFINLIECNPERFMRVNRIVMTNDYRRPSIHPVEVGISTFMFQAN